MKKWAKLHWTLTEKLHIGICMAELLSILKKQMLQRSCDLQNTSATLPNEETAEAARSCHKILNNCCVKKGPGINVVFIP